MILGGKVPIKKQLHRIVKRCRTCRVAPAVTQGGRCADCHFDLRGEWVGK